jgi:uncharacterized protein DUF3179
MRFSPKPFLHPRSGLRALPGLLATVALVSPILAQEPISAEDYTKNAMRAAPRDAFPVMDHPKMTLTAEIGDQIDPEEPVIGLLVEGQARAYPISVMGTCELVNDTVAKIPIAVSW